MFCTSCGAPVNEGNAFCTACGRPVAAQAAPSPVSQPVAPSPAQPVYQPVAPAAQAPSPAQPVYQPMAPAAQAPPPEPSEPQPVVPAPAEAPEAPALSEAAEVPAPQPPADGAINPSVAFLACPACGGNDLLITGQKGGTGKSIGVVLAFGAIGSMVAGSNAAKDTATYPIQYRCNACKNKFESGPLTATAEEILPAPATINFTRKGSMVGAAVPQIVYMNGMKMGPVKNGKTITFQTMVRYNTIFVTDQFGVAFKDSYRFEAQPGAEVQVDFNRKFV